MTSDRFTLERGHWYGLTMFPGYGDTPYHSPIRVDEVQALGNREFVLRFLNLAYAAGVQGFITQLRTLRRAQSHVVAEVTEAADRTYIITNFTPGWLSAHFPHFDANRFFDASGNPDERTLLGLAATAY